VHTCLRFGIGVSESFRRGENRSSITTPCHGNSCSGTRKTTESGRDSLEAGDGFPLPHARMPGKGSMVRPALEARDLPQNPEIWLPGRRRKVANRRTARELGCRSLHSWLEDLLDDHDQPVSPRGSTNRTGFSAICRAYCCFGSCCGLLSRSGVGRTVFPRDPIPISMAVFLGKTTSWPRAMKCE
jgi:hypothetical protein